MGKFLRDTKAKSRSLPLWHPDNSRPILQGQIVIPLITSTRPFHAFFIAFYSRCATLKKKMVVKIKIYYSVVFIIVRVSQYDHH